MARFFNPFNQFFNGSGRLLPGAKLFFYENGTTTLQDTFSDAALTTPNTNPVICDGDGRVPPIYMGDSTIYSVTLTDANDVQIAQTDDYNGAIEILSALSGNSGAIVINGTTLTVNTTTGFFANQNVADFSALFTNSNASGSGLRIQAGTNASQTALLVEDRLGNDLLSVNGVGDTSITGALSKGSGSFKIGHPLMPDSHYLVHSFVESPRAENLYSGMVDLVNGTAQVNLDSHSGMSEGTYEALNHTRSWSSSNETGYSAVKCSISGNILTIECEDSASNDTVYFEVRGERKDQHMLDTNWTDDNGRVIVEPQKDTLSDSENQQ